MEVGKMNLSKHPLMGMEVRDKITGFRGIVTGVTFWLFGCARMCVKPKVDESGKECPEGWFDENQLEVISQGVAPETAILTGQPGGPDPYKQESR